MALFFVAFGLGVLSFFPVDYLGFYLIKAVLVSFGLGCGFLFLRSGRRVFAGGKLSLRDGFWSESGVRFLALAYFVLVLLYGVLSVAPWHSMFEVSVRGWDWISHFLYFGVFLLILMGFGEKEKKHFLRLVLGVNLVGVAYGIVQLLGIDPLAGVWEGDRFLGRIFSVVGHPNWLASLVLLTLPVCLLGCRNNWMKGIVLGGNLLVMFGTGSKAGILGLLFMLVVWGVDFLRNRGSVVVEFLKKKFLWFLGGVVLVSLMIALGAVIFQGRYVNEFEVGRSTNSRLLIWQSALEMIYDRPLGYGLDSFELIYPGYVNEEIWNFEDINSHTASAHNLFLDLWINVGPLGVLVYLLLVLGVIVKGMRPGNGVDKWLALGVLGYQFSNLFGFGVFVNELLFWAFVALIVLPKEKRVVLSGVKSFGIRFLGFVFLILGVVGIGYLKGTFSYTQSLAYESVGDYEKSYEAINLAIDEYPFDSVFLLRGAEMSLGFGELERAERFTGDVKWLRNDLDVEGRGIEALVLLKKGKLNEAELMVENLVEEFPNVISVAKLEVLVYRVTGDVQKEAEAIERFKALLPDYWDQPDTELGRIFYKLNPELIDFLEN